MIRMIKGAHTAQPNAGPELTPLIDIVFIVVVFLLLTANAQVLSLPIDIPDTDSKLSKAVPNKHALTVAVKATPPYWVLDVENRGTYQYEDWFDFKESLLARLSQNESSLFITPESHASAEKLLQLLALLNEQAFSDVQILMEPEK